MFLLSARSVCRQRLSGFQRAKVRRLSGETIVDIRKMMRRSIVVAPGFKRKSTFLKLYSRCTVFGSRSSFGTSTKMS